MSVYSGCDITDNDTYKFILIDMFLGDHLPGSDLVFQHTCKNNSSSYLISVKLSFNMHDVTVYKYLLKFRKKATYLLFCLVFSNIL